MITLMSLTGSHVPLRGTQELAYTTYCISGPDIKNHCRLLELSDALIQVWEERSQDTLSPGVCSDVECIHTTEPYYDITYFSVCVNFKVFFEVFLDSCLPFFYSRNV